jgi:hypothetical protein
MPMGLVTDQDWESELEEDSTNEVNDRSELAEIKNIPTLGRGTGNPNVPDVLRKVIGSAASEERQVGLRVAEMFGISDSSVNAYSVGATSCSTYNKPQESLGKFIRDRKVVITKRASNKLLKALNAITDESLQECKPTELAMVAKSMSSVVRDMEPNATQLVSDKGGPTFVFYTPKLVTEEHFETIEVKE